MLGQLIYSMDLIMVRNILQDDEMVATYKVGSLIITQLMILPSIIQKTLFVELAKMEKNKHLLLNYVYSYLKIAGPITITIALFLYVFSDTLILAMYGDEYKVSSQILRICILSMIMSFLSLKPFSGLLMALGKSNWNVLNASFTAIINYVLNVIYIEQYGIVGAAYATVISFSVSGVLSILLFTIYIKKYCS